MWHYQREWVSKQKQDLWSFKEENELYKRLKEYYAGLEMSSPVGKGLVALVNKDNTCWMTVIIKCLLSLQKMKLKYLHEQEESDTIQGSFTRAMVKIFKFAYDERQEDELEPKRMTELASNNFTIGE